MSKKASALSLAAATLLLLLTAAGAAGSNDASFSSENDNTPSSGAIAADILLLRPLSFAGTLLGTAVFIVGLPFEAISGDVSGPAKRLVVEPAQFTFSRPLGETGGRNE